MASTAPIFTKLGNSALRGDFSPPNFTQTNQEIYEVWAEIHLHPEVTMTVTNPIFMKFILDWQLSAINAYNKFH
jgi:hypothetical protein